MRERSEELLDALKYFVDWYIRFDSNERVEDIDIKNYQDMIERHEDIREENEK